MIDTRRPGQLVCQVNHSFFAGQLHDALLVPDLTTEIESSERGERSPDRMADSHCATNQSHLATKGL